MKKWLLYNLLIFVSTGVCAQDPRFSQYFSAPLAFNPAFTGYFDGGHRLALNVRNQWANLNDPYTTGSISFDTKILKNTISDNDKWGVGIQGLYDQSAGGIFKNSYLSLSTGFHKGLDAEGTQSIGIGIQATYARASVDFSRLSFGNQYVNGRFDLSVPSGESFNDRSLSYLDVNAGILYNYTDENNNKYSFGASMYHILKPNISFFSNGKNSLDRRYAIHAGASLNAGEIDNLFLSTNLMYQGGANEAVIGAAYGFGIRDADATLYTGVWLRVKDAFYPYIGFQTNSYQLGISYDITSSDLRRVKGFNSSTELSFLYFFNTNTKRAIPCFF